MWLGGAVTKRRWREEAGTVSFTVSSYDVGLFGSYLPLTSGDSLSAAEASQGREQEMTPVKLVPKHKLHEAVSV